MLLVHFVFVQQCHIRVAIFHTRKLVVAVTFVVERALVLGRVLRMSKTAAQLLLLTFLFKALEPLAGAGELGKWLLNGCGGCLSALDAVSVVPLTASCCSLFVCACECHALLVVDSVNVAFVTRSSLLGYSCHPVAFCLRDFIDLTLSQFGQVLLQKVWSNLSDSAFYV